MGSRHGSLHASSCQYSRPPRSAWSLRLLSPSRRQVFGDATSITKSGASGSSHSLYVIRLCYAAPSTKNASGATHAPGSSSSW